MDSEYLFDIYPMFNRLDGYYSNNKKNIYNKFSIKLSINI